MKAIGCLMTVAAVLALASLPATAQVPIPVDEIAKAHQEAKATLDPTLPKRVDSAMVLTGVKIDGVTFTYQFKIDGDKANLTPEARDALGKKAMATACINPVSRKIIDAGGRYGFEFSDRFDEMIMSATVGKGDCVI